MLAYQHLNKRNLYNNYVFSKGEITKYKSWKFREVQFVIEGIKLEDNASMTIFFPGCGKCISKHLKELKQHNFPVIYNKEDSTNHEILIFNKQYQKLEIAIPDNVKSIVDKISKCCDQN